MMTSPSEVAVARKDGRSGRFYEVDGKSYPSVTTILSVINKPALVNWAAKVERELVLDVSADLYMDTRDVKEPMSRPGWLTTMQMRLGKAKAAQKELAKAGEIGSQVHALIEWNLRRRMLLAAGPEPRVGDNAMWAFMAWEDWAKSVSLRPLWIEIPVYSSHYGYAGTMDLIADVDGEETLLDWKTGKAVYAEAHLQNAAYRQAVCEMGFAHPAKGMIVRLPKVETDPEFEVVEVAAGDGLFTAFLAAKALWEWTQKANGGSKDEEDRRAAWPAHATRLRA